ncbi:hypothetical protein Srufu_040040 [Streptomyces libani subsp. rufus]|nr:hypothetical protein Srufu_040040 [Streptomyces libani subsp. rufus]
MQTDLDAGLTALVVDQRRAGVQTADEGVVRAGGLPGIGVTGRRERLIEGEDQGQPRRGEPTVPTRWQPGLPVSGVLADVRAERRRGTHARLLVHRAGAAPRRRFT